MNSFNLYRFDFFSEDENEDLSKSLQLSVHPYSAPLLKSHYLKCVSMGKKLQIIGNHDKSHLLKSFDFPIDLFFELKLINENIIKTHHIESGMRKEAYFYDLTEVSDSFVQDINEVGFDSICFPNTLLSHFMKSGVYSLFNINHDKISVIEPPYSGYFRQFLDEEFGAYYMTSDEVDQVFPFYYGPNVGSKSLGLVKIRIKEYNDVNSMKVSFKLLSRAIELRYLFTFNNDPGEFELEVANKKGPLDLRFMGKETLLNGKVAFRYHLMNKMKLSDINNSAPIIATFKSTKNNSPIQGYTLPERLYLPLVSSRSIKAEKENYYTENFVNI